MKIPKYYETIYLIDNYLKNESINNENLYELINESDIEYYFFKKVSSIKWYTSLKIRGYFASRNAPSPIPSDKEGYFSVPYWHVLDYLERISLELQNPENEKYITDIIEIIKEISYNGNKDNYRTWMYLARITANLPEGYITDELLDLIPIWMGSKFDSTLPGKEIADKLLPIFLKSNNPEDHLKAEKILIYLTALKPLSDDQKKSVRFRNGEDFLPVYDGYWLNETFNKFTEEISKKCTNKLIKEIINNIEKILSNNSSLTIDYKDNTLFIILNENKENYLVELYEFDHKLTPEEQYNIYSAIDKEDQLNNVKKKNVTIDNCITITEFIQKASSKLLTDYPELKNKINDYLHDLYYGLYNTGTYESFYNEEPLRAHNTLGIYNSIFKKVFIPRIETHSEDSKEIILKLHNSKYFYFHKFLFYIIGLKKEFYLKYKDILLEYLRNDKYNLFFKTLYFGDETGKILEKIDPFNTEILDIIDKKIEEEAIILSKHRGEKIFLKSWKQRYYKSLSHIKKFDEKYNELKNETGIDPELGPAIQLSETRIGHGPSPFSYEELFNKSNIELAVYLKEFKTKDPWDGPTEDGLAEQIRKVVESNPEKFYDDLAPLIDSPYYYIYEIFWGFVDVSKNKGLLNWSKIFEFIIQYINRDVFWKNQLEIKGNLNAGYEWVVGAIAELIQSVSRKENSIFDDELNNQALEIIELLIGKIKNDNEVKSNNPVSHAINSPYGKTLEALINLSLKEFSYNEKNGSTNENWKIKFITIYENALKENYNEAYTFLGYYIGQLYYLDKAWLEEKIKFMTGLHGKSKNWNYFMSGYLYSQKVYNVIYKLMAPQYEFALSNDFEEDRNERLLIQHIAIGYLRGIDGELKKPLYNLMIEKWDNDQIEEFIGFLWMQRDYLADIDSKDQNNKPELRKKFVGKILDFWKTIYNHYKEKKTFVEKDKNILSSAGKLAVFLHEINNESFEWMKLSAPHIQIEHNSSFFIEYMDYLKDKGNEIQAAAHWICDIFLAILETYIPDFEKKHIYSIVKYVYETSKKFEDTKLKEKADDICNIYGPSGITSEDNGREFLRDLYEENNK